MRVIRLTPAEWVQVAVDAIRDESGMIVLRVPDNSIERDAPRLTIANPHIVRYGDRQAALQPIPHAIVRHVLARGPTSFEDLQDAIWIGQEVSDTAIKRACSRASERLFEAGIPYRVSAIGGHVAIESEE